MKTSTALNGTSSSSAIIWPIMAGIPLAVGRAVGGMVIAEFLTTINGLGAIIITSANISKPTRCSCRSSC